jgi:hypothetical protein
LQITAAEAYSLNSQQRLILSRLFDCWFSRTSFGTGRIEANHAMALCQAALQVSLRTFSTILNAVFSSGSTSSCPNFCLQQTNSCSLLVDCTFFFCFDIFAIMAIHPATPLGISILPNDKNLPTILLPWFGFCRLSLSCFIACGTGLIAGSHTSRFCRCNPLSSEPFQACTRGGCCCTRLEAT